MLFPNECKRLAETDFPLLEVALNGADEKQISTGHVSGIHVWWARRPLATSRAMNLSLLLPDPEDGLCPDAVKNKLDEILKSFEQKNLHKWSVEGVKEEKSGQLNLRSRLISFIGEFSSWDLKGSFEHVKCARELVEACYDSAPNVLDPFSGGGSIPLESLRIGANTFATDLNPIPLILNKLQLIDLPSAKEEIIQSVQSAAEHIDRVLADEVQEFYPKPNGRDEVPVAYICARTIQCESASCGIEFPLLSSTYVTKKKEKIYMKFSRKANKLEHKLCVGDADVERTVYRGNATCPLCGYVTKQKRVQIQLRKRTGGTQDSVMLAVVVSKKGTKNKQFRLPTQSELDSRELAKNKIAELEEQTTSKGDFLIPNETCKANSRYLTTPLYGMEKWRDIYTARQLLTQLILVREIAAVEDNNVRTILALIASKLADRNCSLAGWVASGNRFGRCFGLQSIQMTWDFVEINPVSGHGPSWMVRVKNGILSIRAAMEGIRPGEANVLFADAQNHPLPDRSIDALFTDPPYYDKVPYSNLSNFFVIWLKRMLDLDTLSEGMSSKNNEIIVDMKDTDGSGNQKNSEWYESSMLQAFKEQRRIIKDSGIGYVVYADKSTEGWATILSALVDSKWSITGSWPIATELSRRMRAQRSAALNTSVHIIIRPRLSDNSVGFWSDIVQELPLKIQSWMDRLSKTNVVGADAIFSCVGPAMELFSKYDIVEKSDGEAVTVRDFLKVLWDAVAREALRQAGAISGKLDDDARLTLLILWTLRNSGGSIAEEKEIKASNSKLTYDTCLNLSRGVGVDLEKCINKGVVKLTKNKNETIVELLSPANRKKYLFGSSYQSESEKLAKLSNPKSNGQMRLGESAEDFQQRIDLETKRNNLVDVPLKDSFLDKIHQAMVLHANGDSASLDNHLRNNMGDESEIWQLANTLNSLYPEGSWERAKVEAIIARKESLR